MEIKSKSKCSRGGTAKEGDRYVTKKQGDGSRKYDGSSKTILRAHANGCTKNNVDYHISRPRDS